MKVIANTQNKLMRSCALVVSSLILFSSNALGQDGGPSIGNVNKTLNAAKDQMSKEEKMSYIGMGVGFILVMAIAWFSTNAAKKRRIAREEMVRRHHLNSHAKHNTHDPYYRTHGQGAKVRPK